MRRRRPIPKVTLNIANVPGVNGLVSVEDQGVRFPAKAGADAFEDLLSGRGFAAIPDVTRHSP